MSSFLKSSLGLLISLSLIGSTQAVELDTDLKRYSYALGHDYIQHFYKQGIPVDMEAFTAAVNDVRENSIRMSMEERSTAMRIYHERLFSELSAVAEANLQAGQQFLEKNKNQPGVVVLPSGLQYIEHRAGEGISPTESSTVKVHYRGTLINGKEFDSSKPDQPVSLDQRSSIPGFREALTLMKPGAKWTVFIPPQLGFGQVGWEQKIGPNETIVFDIELVSVE